MNKPAKSMVLTASYVGRVGALAVALGVGSAIGALPVAAADTTTSSRGADSSNSTAAKPTAAKTPTEKTPRRGALRSGRGGAVAPQARPESAVAGVAVRDSTTRDVSVGAGTRMSTVPDGEPVAPVRD